MGGSGRGMRSVEGEVGDEGRSWGYGALSLVVTCMKFGDIVTIIIGDNILFLGIDGNGRGGKSNGGKEMINGFVKSSIEQGSVAFGTDYGRFLLSLFIVSPLNIDHIPLLITIVITLRCFLIVLLFQE